MATVDRKVAGQRGLRKRGSLHYDRVQEKKNTGLLSSAKSGEAENFGPPACASCGPTRLPSSKSWDFQPLDEDEVHNLSDAGQDTPSSWHPLPLRRDHAGRLKRRAASDYPRPAFLYSRIVSCRRMPKGVVASVSPAPWRTDELRRAIFIAPDAIRRY